MITDPLPVYGHGREVTSENCRTCKLHEECKNPFFAPMTDSRSSTRGTNTILVLSDFPDPRDARAAGTYYHRGVSKLREDVLNNLDCRWEFHTVTRCAPKQGEKPKPRQVKLCIEEHLKPTIIKMKPRAIVCMGKEALNAVLGEDSPKNMNDLKGGYLYVEEMNMRVYCAEHPAKMTIPEVNKDALAEHYTSVFSKAEAYAMETEYREPVQFSLLRTPMQVMELAGKRFEEFAFDIETNYPIMDKRGLKDPNRNTFWKPGARCISLAITYYDERTKRYVNSVIVEEGLKDLVPLKRLFRDRVAIAHNCLTGDSLVSLADGTKMRLDKMVRTKHEGPVLTINEVTGELEAKKVVGWVDNERRDWSDWVQIKVAGKGTISLTADHEVLTTRGRVQAGSVVPGDRILTNKTSLTKAQEWLLVGSTLGDGSLVKQKNSAARSPYFCVSHSEKQKEYLAWKAGVLESLGVVVKEIPPSNRGFSNHTVMHRLRTKSDSRLNFLYEKGLRRDSDFESFRTNLGWLSSPAVLAVWFCDDGSWSGRRIQICVSAFKEKAELLKQGLLSEFGVDSRLYERPDGQKYLCVEGDSCDLFLEKIAPFVPPAMEYKLPERLRGKYDASLWEGKEESVWSDVVVSNIPLLREEGSPRRSGRIRSSERGCGPKQFCLEVEDNHNFFASGLSVSNCKFDIQGLYALLGLDILALVKRFEDTQVPFYISDQNRMSTSLKNLARGYLENVGDWEVEGKELVVRANIEVVKHRKALADKIADYSKLRKQWEIYEQGKGKIMLGSEKAAWNRAAKAILASGHENFMTTVKLLHSLKEELDSYPIPGLCSYADIPIIKLAEYNAEDTLRTLQLWREVIPFLERIDGFTYSKDCYEMIKEFIRTICYVERDGFLIDVKALDELEQKLLHEEEGLRQILRDNPRVMQAAERAAAVKKAREKGQEPAWDKVLSPKNASFMAEVAREYGVFHLGNRTEKGGVTFGKLVLPGIMKHFQKHTNNEKAIELFQALDDLRFSMDLRSKFINNWRMWVVDGVFHCDYKVIANVNLGFARGKDAGGGAQSGRLSCTRINLQQIFKLFMLREVFKAPDGFFIAELDFKSLEPMLMAFVTNCERLKDVFRRGLDLYRVTCNDIFEKGVDLNQPDDVVRKLLADPNLISDKERKLFKVGFLSWVYGTGVKRFAQLLEISEDEARAFFIRAKEIYYEIFEYKQDIQQMVDEGRALYSYTERRRTFPVLPPQNYSEEEQERYRKDRNKAFRIAVNAGIQVLGSDITLIQASRIRRWIEENNYQDVIRICNLVHDSIWFYIKKTHAHLYWELIKMMEDIGVFKFKMDVPLVAEGTVGYNLGESMGLDDQKERQIEIMKELGILK